MLHISQEKNIQSDLLENFLARNDAPRRLHNLAFPRPYAQKHTACVTLASTRLPAGGGRATWAAILSETAGAAERGKNRAVDTRAAAGEEHMYSANDEEPCSHLRLLAGSEISATLRQLCHQSMHG
jgi:hypothetical protein